jgi:ribosomal protein L32E
MATTSTLRVIHPEIGAVRKPQPHESRLRRLFRRRARRRDAAVASGWREEAAVRGMTRMGA